MKKHSRLHEGLNYLGIQSKAWEQFKSRNVKALSVEDNKVYLEGPIISGDDAWIMEWLGNESFITPENFRSALNDVKGDAVLNINSPGGDVFAASAIIDSIIERNDPVDAKVSGIAASAAASVALFARKVEMSPMSMLMFHHAWSNITGNAKEMRAMSKTLEKIDGTLLDEMTRKTSMSRDEAIGVLDGDDGNGTFYTAKEAVEAGFADTVSESSSEPEPESSVEDEEIINRMRNRMRAAYRQSISQ